MEYTQGFYWIYHSLHLSCFVCEFESAGYVEFWKPQPAAGFVETTFWQTGRKAHVLRLAIRSSCPAMGKSATCNYRLDNALNYRMDIVLNYRMGIVLDYRMGIRKLSNGYCSKLSNGYFSKLSNELLNLSNGIIKLLNNKWRKFM